MHGLSIAAYTLTIVAEYLVIAMQGLIVAKQALTIAVLNKAIHDISYLTLYEHKT